VAAAYPGQKESASGRRKATLSVFKHLNDLLVRHAFVPFQKIANCRARLKVLEQSRYRQPGTFEYKRAANPPGHSFYRVAIRPVQHAMTVSNLAAGVKRRANVNIARRLRSESSMSGQWIADRLKMGSPSCLSALTSVIAPGGATHRFQSQLPERLLQKPEQQRLLLLQGVPSL